VKTKAVSDHSFLKSPIFLCGMMGSGKSTVGKALSDILGISFSDLDTLIVNQEGISIPEIFESKGESGFRMIEQKLLIQHAKTTKGILALGGGALQDQQIVDHVKSYGWLVFLETPLEVLVNRLKSGRGRPMLNKTEVKNLDNRIENLLKERLPYYHQAHIIIQTGSSSKKQVAEQIVKKLKSYEA